MGPSPVLSENGKKISDLPENLLLKIFGYLPVKELCIIGRVCRQWRRIVRDNSLWRHVDLLNYRLDLKKMWKVIRSHLSECLISIKVKGFMDTGKPKSGAHSLSDAMLNDLKDRCPNLEEIHLKNCNTTNLNPKLFPSTLVKLTLENCAVQPGLMKNFSQDLPQLLFLNVSGTVRFDDIELSYLCQAEQLKVLIIVNGCYCVSVESLSKIAQNLKNLLELELADTGIKNTNQNLELAVHHMTRNLSSLQHLNFKGCASLSPVILQNLLSGLKKLKILNIACCSDVKYTSLVSMEQNMKGLRLLELCESQMEGHNIEGLESLLLECSVHLVEPCTCKCQR
ncbi:F-box/LRR-repeat protein 12-like [Saccostrea echinata]|uniref:F-box/LRR-repeat protein 12-like n=1 Tax=Saccostrea echinata TaxID=191078 RepID=UPI002A82EC88|nr:F-box/LRR-repeat protein 12-like [Saccostrea echinata]